MKYIIICLILFSQFIFPHDKDESRAHIFKDELRVNDQVFNAITEIDKFYRTKYQKINAEISFRRSELNEVIYTKPYNQQKAKLILQEIANAQTDMRLHAIQHHFEIEKKLDSFQKMKFNEIFNP